MSVTLTSAVINTSTVQKPLSIIEKTCQGAPPLVQDLLTVIYERPAIIEDSIRYWGINQAFSKVTDVIYDLSEDEYRKVMEALRKYASLLPHNIQKDIINKVICFVLQYPIAQKSLFSSVQFEYARILCSITNIDGENAVWVPFFSGNAALIKELLDKRDQANIFFSVRNACMFTPFDFLPEIESTLTSSEKQALENLKKSVRYRKMKANVDTFKQWISMLQSQFDSLPNTHKMVASIEKSRVKAKYPANYGCQGTVIVTRAPSHQKGMPDFLELLTGTHNGKKVSLVVTLNNPDKNDQCFPWWLEEGITVSNESALKEDSNLISSQLSIKDHALVHLRATAWDDGSFAPRGTLIRILKFMEKHRKEFADSLIVIHCKYGYGRTGVVLVSCDLAGKLSQLKEKITAIKLDSIIYKSTLVARGDLANAIQNSSQYVYLHEEMLSLAMEKGLIETQELKEKDAKTTSSNAKS